MGVNARPRSLRRMISDSFGSSFGASVADRKDDETTASGGRSKNVSFSEANNQIYRIDATELSLEEKRRLWYTKEESDALLEQAKSISAEFFKSDDRAKTLRRLFLRDCQCAEDIDHHMVVSLQADIVGLAGFFVPSCNRKRLVKRFQTVTERFPRNGSKRAHQISLVSAKESLAPRSYARYCALGSWKAETAQE